MRIECGNTRVQDSALWVDGTTTFPGKLEKPNCKMESLVSHQVDNGKVDEALHGDRNWDRRL